MWTWLHLIRQIKMQNFYISPSSLKPKKRLHTQICYILGPLEYAKYKTAIVANSDTVPAATIMIIQRDIEPPVCGSPWTDWSDGLFVSKVTPASESVTLEATEYEASVPISIFKFGSMLQLGKW